MVQTTWILVFAVVVVVSVGNQWRSRTRARAEDRLGGQYGCQPIRTVLKGKWPLSVDLVKGLLMHNASETLLSYFQPWIDALGPTLELHLFGNVGLVTVDPENIKAVLTKSKLRDGEFDFVYGKRRDALLPLFGEGLFTQDGAAWKHSREVLRKHFARIQYNNLEVFEPHVELLVSRLLSSSSDVLDLQPLFLNFTLDTTTKLLFGESAGSLHGDASDEFGKNFNYASWVSAIRVQLAYLYWLCCPPSYFKACNKIRDYTNHWVKKALDPSIDEKHDADPYIFIKSLYQDLRDRDLVREQLVNVLLAGRDTTAGLLSWTFRLLLRHNRVFQKLKEEIASVLDGDTEITKAKLQRLPYLKHVLTETLRLYPLVPINFREAGHATVLPRGGGKDGLAPLLVRAGTGIGYSPYHMHRRKDFYGEDAFSFRPERWEDGTLQERIGWGYLPFNGGPRICLGQEFALLEASYAIVRIVQTFPNLTLPADEKNEEIGSERQSIALTMSPSEGCRVHLGRV